MSVRLLMYARAVCCPLLFAGIAATSACSARTGPGSPSAPGKPTPEQALKSQTHALDVYIKSADESPDSREAMTRAVADLLALAANYPAASKEVAVRQKALRQSITSDPRGAPVTEVEMYLEICRQTVCKPDALSLLRELTATTPTATGVRGRLLRSQLDSMRKQGLYADIYANRDLLESEFQLSSQMTDYFIRQTKVSAIALYEAALASGNPGEAHNIAAKAMAFRPSAQMLEGLTEAATRLGSPAEIERLKELSASTKPE